MSESNVVAPVAAEVQSSPESVSSEAVETVESLEAEGSVAGEAQEAVQDAIANGASAKEVANMLKKFKIKVDGKEMERELDLSNEDNIKQMLQLAEVSKKRMSETAELKKALQQEINRLKNDPFAVLEELGLNPDELSEKRIQSRIEELKKSPEQLAKEKLDRELTEAREELNKYKKQQEESEMRKLQEQVHMQINTEIDEALSAHKTLPKTPHVRKKIADSLVWAMDQGFEDVSVKDIMPMVEKEFNDDLAKMIDDSDDELIEKYFGKAYDRIRKARLSRSKAKIDSAQQKQVQNLTSVKPVASNSVQESKKGEKILARDFFRKLGKNS